MNSVYLEDQAGREPLDISSDQSVFLYKNPNKEGKENKRPF